ncbi:MAG: hypothetical protein WCA20_22525 [Candidatus Sulfotelmatobacter sp.]
MSPRKNILGLIFLVVVLGVAVFVLKRLRSPTGPAGGGVAQLHPDASSRVTAPLAAKPSAAVPAPSSNGKEQQSTPGSGVLAGSGGGGTGSRGAGGEAVPAASSAAPAPAAKSATPAAEDHSPQLAPQLAPQLEFEAGVRLWIRVTVISRKPDGSFTFRGTLLQTVTLANTNQLDQGTELAGSGTVSTGHVTVLVTGFTVGGANYALQSASGSNRRPGSGPAVELDPGKLFEVWFASSSVYRRAP